MAEQAHTTARRALSVQNPPLNAAVQTTRAALLRRPCESQNGEGKSDPQALIGTARACLYRMATNCLTMTRRGHQWDLEIVRCDLEEALSELDSGTARDAVRRVAGALQGINPSDRSRSLDDLGSAYHIAELRLSALLLADIESRQGARP